MDRGARSANRGKVHEELRLEAATQSHGATQADGICFERQSKRNVWPSLRMTSWSSLSRNRPPSLAACDWPGWLVSGRPKR